MTASVFANLAGARSTGRGKWKCLCPAHPDRSPSLSIKEGRDGRVLQLCRSHSCPPQSIVAALGLTMRDLFSDAPISLQARAEARRLKAEREAKERAQAKTERRANRLYRRLVCAADALAWRLARLPDGAEAAALAGVFHAECLMRDEAADTLGICPETTSERIVSLHCSPFAEPDAEWLEAGRVRTEAQLRWYVGTGQAGTSPAFQPERERGPRPDIGRWRTRWTRLATSCTKLP